MDGFVEDMLIGGGRLRHTGDLAHVLRGSGMDLVRIRTRFEVVEGLDVAAHVASLNRAGVDVPLSGYADGMTTQPTGSPQKDPDNWATGDEPATSAPLSYLETLSNDTGTELPADLTKARASQLIDELRQQSPRVSEGDA